MTQTPIEYDRGRKRFDTVTAKYATIGTLTADSILADSMLTSGNQTIDGKLTVTSGIVSPTVISGNLTGNTTGVHIGTVSGLISGLAGTGLLAGANNLSLDYATIGTTMAGAGLTGATSGKVAISTVIVRDVIASLISGEIGAKVLTFPYPAVLTQIRGQVVQDVVTASASGRITLANSSGATTIGVMSSPASGTVGTALVALTSPSAVNIASGGTVTITTAVASSGGRVLLSIEHTKTG
jgi:hypothetical protein